MDIAKIDKNFKFETKLNEPDLVWYDASKAPFVLYGMTEKYDGENYRRMPKDIGDNTSAGVKVLNYHTTGIRTKFCTDSPCIAIKVVYPQVDKMSHMPLTGNAGFDIYKVVSGKYFLAGAARPEHSTSTDFETIILKGNTAKNNFVLNFPLYNGVCKVYVGVKKGSVLDEPVKYINEKPVIFYGSSITQGGCATRPGNTYQNFLSRELDMDYINLGFSGNAQGEQIMADFMAGLDMSVFVSDYDYNSITAEHLEATHYTLYETIRKTHPDIPYIMVTLPTPNCCTGETWRRKIVMQSYIKALDSGDKNVYFIDGDSLFAGSEYDACTVDICHPNDMGFYRMARGMMPILKPLLYK